ncbi:MAG: LysM peptidoglycan-binding domain-containing protein [Bacteroidales bacterium]|nr:LysM peptidoglycan-binding domain-containing protein [Bacteroidales bacterium]
MKSISRILLTVMAICAVQVALADTYIVDRGDTLETIAQKFGVTQQQIIDLNPDAASFIYVGMELQIPASSANPANTANPVSANTTVTYNAPSNQFQQNAVKVESESSANDNSEQKWGCFIQMGLGFIKNKSVSDKSTYSSARMDVTSFAATINGFYDFYQGAKAFVGLGYRSSDSYAYESEIGSHSSLEQNNHFLTVPLGLGYTFGSFSKIGLTPIAAFDFNIGLKSKIKGKQNGSDVSMPKPKTPKTCVDFQLGAHIHLWGFGIFGSYHFPVNKKQKGYFGEDGYFEVGISGWLNL